MSSSGICHPHSMQKCRQNLSPRGERCVRVSSVRPPARPPARVLGLRRERRSPSLHAVSPESVGESNALSTLVFSRPSKRLLNAQLARLSQPRPVPVSSFKLFKVNLIPRSWKVLHKTLLRTICYVLQAFGIGVGNSSRPSRERSRLEWQWRICHSLRLSRRHGGFATPFNTLCDR